LVVMGAGVVGLGVGTLFALSAKSRYDDSLNHCDRTNHDLCDPQGVSTRNDARSAGNVATAALGGGAAAVVVGGVVWLTAPSGARPTSAASVVVAPTLGGAVVRGAW